MTTFAPAIPIQPNDRLFVDLLPNNWFTIENNFNINDYVKSITTSNILITKQLLIHYNKPIDKRATTFLTMSLKEKLSFLQSYDISNGNPYYYSISGKPKNYTYIDILNELSETKNRLEFLIKCIKEENIVITEENPNKNVNKKTKKKTIPKALKSAVWIKYIGKDIGITKCICCNSHDISQLDFDCGHVIAEALGGETILENLRPICSKCNKSMGVMNMEEFTLKYFKK
jgi:hypothetical protein